MSQPKWRKIGVVGDVNPLDYSGGFVFVDDTGVYPPEVEYYDRDNDTDNSPIRVYRFAAELCTYVGGILSDNKYHPDHAVWFARDLPDGLTPADFTSPDTMTRAAAWLEVGLYYGLDNLDSYPLVLSYREAEKRVNGR
jgi:hypothetical protein